MMHSAPQERTSLSLYIHGELAKIVARLGLWMQQLLPAIFARWLLGPSHLLGKTNRTSSQLLRYVLAGSIGFALDCSILFLLAELFSLHYLLAAPPAFLAGLSMNYALCVSWVFNRRSLDRRWLEFIVFASLGALGLVLNEAVIWIFTELFAFHYLVSKSFYLAVYLLLFVIRKLLLFR